MDDYGVYQELGKALPKSPLFNEALHLPGKRTFLFCGFGDCGDDTVSISTLQVLLNFIVR